MEHHDRCAPQQEH
jgi:hypothetical protein